jgi:hypothetical protein
VTTPQACSNPTISFVITTPDSSVGVFTERLKQLKELNNTCCQFIRLLSAIHLPSSFDKRSLFRNERHTAALFQQGSSARPSQQLQLTTAAAPPRTSNPP